MNTMSSEAAKETELELAHVLFIDIVGFSKRLINEQRALLDTLNRIVRNNSACEYRTPRTGITHGRAYWPGQRCDRCERKRECGRGRDQHGPTNNGLRR